MRRPTMHLPIQKASGTGTDAKSPTIQAFPAGRRLPHGERDNGALRLRSIRPYLCGGGP